VLFFANRMLVVAVIFAVPVAATRGRRIGSPVFSETSLTQLRGKSHNAYATRELIPSWLNQTSDGTGLYMYDLRTCPVFEHVVPSDSHGPIRIVALYHDLSTRRGSHVLHRNLSAMLSELTTANR